MKVKFHGELTIPELRQALIEQLQYIEDEFLIRHLKHVTLYFTPTNGCEKEIFCQDRSGRKVEEIFCHGPYRSAAEKYDGLG